MTQEKLEQRWENFMASRRISSTSKSWIEFARAELEKAAEILDKWYNCGTDDELNQYELPSELIRKLME